VIRSTRVFRQADYRERMVGQDEPDVMGNYLDNGWRLRPRRLPGPPLGGGFSRRRRGRRRPGRTGPGNSHR